MTQMYTASLFC